MVDAKLVEDVLTRGVENIYPNKDFLKSKLESGETLTLYLGIDPTGPTLHLGHAIALMKLRQFQRLGHKVIVLIGDFTGMIGDPTDKMATRVPLTREQVLENCKKYKEQASVLIDFDGDNPAEFKFNSEWLGELNFGDILDLCSKFTVQQMLERDMFANRMKEGKPIGIHEFMYPLMQGYDCVAMDVDGEVGGNDQTFNMLAGRTLMKIMKKKEKFVVTNKLLVDNIGKKMGKTEGNMLSLEDDHNEKFGKVMSWADDIIVNAFELCTELPMQEIQEMKEFIEGGGNPRDIKLKLAAEIVTIYHGKDKARDAVEYFESTFQKRELDPSSFPDISVADGVNIVDVLVEKCDVESKKQARRLLGQNAIKLDGNVVSDDRYTFGVESDGLVLQVGKKKFFKLKSV